MGTQVGSTPETQAVVVLRALKKLYPDSSQGKGPQAHRIVVRGANSNADVFRIGRIARQYATGYTVDISPLARTYFLVTLTKQKT